MSQDAKRTRIDAAWEVDGDDLLLRIPKAVTHLKEGAMVRSGTNNDGKSESPINVTVPVVAVPRGDEVVEFRSSGGGLLYHRIEGSGGAFSL